MSKTLRTLVIGVDPGTGSSSDTGFCCFDPLSKSLYYAAEIGTDRRELHHRVRQISDVFQETIAEIDGKFADHTILVCIESFVIRGKGGESLQRLIGSFMGRLPYHFELRHVANTKVKLYTAGHGHADKASVAQGVLDFFFDDEEAATHIRQLIANQQFDVLDALAIGVAGWKLELERNKGVGPPAKKRR